MTDLYEELYLSRSLDLAEIKRILAKQKNDWMARSVAMPDEAERMLSLIADAEEAFATEESRAAYDEELARSQVPVDEPDRGAERQRIAEEKRRAEAKRLEIEQQINNAHVLGGIQWRVLEVQNNKALLTARDIVELRRFDAKSNVWASSEIRRWLNSDFLSRFSQQCQKAILLAELQDVHTQDKVFLLSAEEVNRYFSSDSDRIACFEGKAYWWWLRSPGSGGSYHAAYVYNNGSVETHGDYVYYSKSGVRPALWLNLESGIF